MPRATFLLLLALHERPRHGLGLVERVEAATRGQVKLGPGTLYGTLQRLEASGLIRETRDIPDPDDHDTRRRYYRLTPKGERALKDEVARLRVLSDAAAEAFGGGR